MAGIKRKYEKDKHFVTSHWGNLTNYECADCQFKTVNPDNMNTHLDGAPATHKLHPWPEVDPEDDFKLGGKHPTLARKTMSVSDAEPVKEK